MSSEAFLLDGLRWRVGNAVVPSKMIGLGFVIRGNKGKVLACRVKHETYPYESWVAEIKALRIEVRATLNLGLFLLVLEVDALGIASEWSKSPLYFDEKGMLVAELKIEAPVDKVMGFQFVPREGSIVAHALAKLALSSSQERTWINGYPEEISSFVS
ncbi:hypothetical protein Ancab_007634 [Ancistrocladus abbreviatus]